MQCPLQRQVVCRKTGSIRSFGQRSQVSRHMCSRARCSARKPVQERLGEVEGWATKPAEEGLAEAQAWPVKPPHEGPAGPEVWQRRRPSADVWQEKPAWCQPWTIITTGSGVVSIAYLLSGERAWVACLVAVPVAAWWATFLVLYPQAWREYVNSLPAEDFADSRSAGE